MKISNNGLNLIKKWEGCYLKAYRDIVGVWTIGYGTTNADIRITGTEIKQGLIIDLLTANKWLENSVNEKYTPKVEKYQHIYNFNQNQIDALISFAYNVGSIDQLTANGTRTIKQIEEHFLAYCNAGGKRVQGLVNRRNDELNLFKKFDNPKMDQNYDSEISNKSIETLVQETLDGKYGNGEVRKKALGNRYNEVQTRINSLLNNDKYYSKCDSSFKSFVDALKSINEDSSIQNRTKIANKNEITKYTGSSYQNTKLLNLLKEGKLKK